MGKILNTTYHETVESVTGFYNTLVNNSFYTLNDKKPTICTYYNINKDFTSVDPGSKLAMDNIGSDSPIRYNKITDFILYGFNRIELNTSFDEFGLEADRIEGECYILPNTIIPYEGDYFEVPYIKDSTWLFMVKDVQKDTLENGSNAYKISYRLEYKDNKEIQDRIVYNFKMIEVREGTNLSRIVRNEDYETAKIIDDKCVMLKSYYQELFYNPKVQTFIYTDLSEFRAYDPYMIEFLIRNKILDNGEDSYIHVGHQINVNKTFGLEYDKTIFRAFEKKRLDKLACSDYTTYLEQLTSYGTTFSARYEEYFTVKYGDKVKPGYNCDVIDVNIINNCRDNILFEEFKDCYKNILIKYFHNDSITMKEIESIDEIEFKYSKDAFYMIPLLIFCLEKYMEVLLKNDLK